MNILKRGLAAIMLFLFATSCLDSDDAAVIITISNKAQLISFRKSINSGNNDYYGLLTADIDLEGEEWIPIGINGNYPYTGVFNGNGKTIKNFTINSTEDHQGLFGYLDGGYISNLTIEDATIKGGSYVGAICGRVFEEGYIFVCNVTNSTVEGSDNVGGIVGYAGFTPLLNCHNSDTTVKGGNNVGGVAGNSNSSTVTYCSNSGEITATGNSAGGVVGYAYGAYLTACYNNGVVSGESYVGGVAGRVSSTIAACYNTNAVSGSSGIGGVVGYVTNFYPDTYPTNVAGCYNIGTISGTSNAGDVVGETVSTTIFSGCYFTTGSANYAIGSLSSDEGGNVEGTTSIDPTELNALATDPDSYSAIDYMNEAITEEDDTIDYRYTVGDTYPVLTE